MKNFLNKLFGKEKKTCYKHVVLDTPKVELPDGWLIWSLRQDWSLGSYNGIFIEKESYKTGEKMKCVHVYNAKTIEECYIKVYEAIQNDTYEWM